jgi:hypothetical protein
MGGELKTTDREDIGVWESREAAEVKTPECLGIGGRLSRESVVRVAVVARTPGWRTAPKPSPAPDLDPLFRGGETGFVAALSGRRRVWADGMQRLLK